MTAREGGGASILGLVFRFGQILPAGVCSVLICLAPTPHTPLSPKDPVVRACGGPEQTISQSMFGETVPVLSNIWQQQVTFPA